LGDVEYYEIDNHIRTLLPDCLDLRINAGQLGKTKIFNTSNYSYYSDGVRRIVETIRNYMASNNSGEAFFNGVVKLKYNKPNNGKAENYYVEYILFINSESELDDTPVDFNLPKKEQKKVAKIRDTLALRLKNLQKEKSKRIRAKKKAQPKKPAQKKQEAQEAVKSAIAALKKLYQNGTITKSEFEAQKAILVKFKKRP
jgi:single-stranded DNA-specific DHH superfamily exonuclease